MAKQPKFYVVWKGREIGVFTSWEDCKAQTNGFDGAVLNRLNLENWPKKLFMIPVMTTLEKIKKLLAN